MWLMCLSVIYFIAIKLDVRRACVHMSMYSMYMDMSGVNIRVVPPSVLSAPSSASQESSAVFVCFVLIVDYLYIPYILYV